MKKIFYLAAIALIFPACGKMKNPEEALAESERDKAKAALFKVVTDGDIKALKNLLKQGFAINESDEQGRTLLHLAAQGRNVDTVKFLIVSGADINVTDKNGFTPFDLARDNMRWHAVRELRRAGGISNTPAASIHIAAYFGETERVRELLRNGTDVNQKTKRGWTALLYAARGGYTELVELLLAWDADPNVKIEIWTPLIAALQRCDSQRIVELLINAGADVNLKAGELSPLYEVINNPWPEMAKLLIDKGADVNVRAFGRTLLHVAVEKQHLPTVKLLLENGADINATDKDGKTPLDLAKKDEITGFLKTLGAVSGQELRGEGK